VRLFVGRDQLVEPQISGLRRRRRVGRRGLDRDPGLSITVGVDQDGWLTFVVSVGRDRGLTFTVGVVFLGLDAIDIGVNGVVARELPRASRSTTLSPEHDLSLAYGR
jgi:hypothetical protein